MPSCLPAILHPNLTASRHDDIVLLLEGLTLPLVKKPFFW